MDLGGAVTQLAGAQAWLEAGYRPLSRVGIFARGYVTDSDRGLVGGVRWTF